MLAFLVYETTPVAGQERSAFFHRVVGRVMDRENHPVASARVCANPQGGLGERIVCAVSQQDGSFRLGPLRPRVYTISAEDKIAGYPDAYNSFYGGFFGEMPVIVISERKEPGPVSVIVGPKAGRAVFRLVDDQSGKRIDGGVVKACRIDKPRMCWSLNTAFPQGEYEMLTPEVPFTIEFETWRRGHKPEKRTAYDEATGPLRVLQIDLGARKVMSVRLRLAVVTR